MSSATASSACKTNDHENWQSNKLRNIYYIGVLNKYKHRYLKHRVHFQISEPENQ